MASRDFLSLTHPDLLYGLNLGSEASKCPMHSDFGIPQSHGRGGGLQSQGKETVRS